MRPLNSLSFDSLVNLLSVHFSGLADHRHPNRINYSLHDTLMTGFAMFFFQHPSLLQFQSAMKQKRGRCNLETLFAVGQLPAEPQMRDLLDEVDSQEVRKLLPIFFEQMRRAGWASQYQTNLENGFDAGTYYVVALDGTEYFSSTKIACSNCLRRKDQSGQLHCYHAVVAATLVKYRWHQVFPLNAEMIANTDGSEKQDCETKAGKRLLERLRQEHPQMAIIISADDLYSRQPFIEKCVENRLHYVLVAKEESHPEMSEWVAELKEIGGWEKVERSEGAACERKTYE